MDRSSAALLVVASLGLVGCGAPDATTSSPRLTHSQAQATDDAVAPAAAVADAARAGRFGSLNSAARNDLPDQQFPHVTYAPPKIDDFRVGTGRTAHFGDVFVVNYVASFEDGTVIADTLSDGRPVSMTFTGTEARAWGRHLAGMRAGGIRSVQLPAALAFSGNDAFAGLIPPDKTVYFDVELVEVHTPTTPTTAGTPSTVAEVIEAD
ncbi:MAG: FKBP-type peptidyl-prolyl cis-trans isomerase [Phycisphaerales bacterium]|nr:FKBP-type peptidyl-prolyl cis-trans isomerase [Phycisphaerales bacterium]